MPAHYAKNFLSDVIFKIQLSELNELNEDSARQFKDAIHSRFPKSALVEQQGIHIDASGSGNELTATTRIDFVWTYSTDDDSMKVELQKGSLALVVKKYTHFDDFKQTVTFICAALNGVVSFANVATMGVRYINQIQLNDQDKFDWKPYINGDLVKSFDFIEDKSVLRRSFQQMFLSIDEDTSLTFGFGIFNSLYPAQMLNKEFVLDYDCISKAPFESNLLEEKLARFNTIITDMFEKSITEGMRRVLNG